MANDFHRDRWLVVSDTQKPYEAERALSLCKYAQKHFKIPDENCTHAGDETDQMHGGLYPKGADYDHTPNSELQAAKEKMLEWYSVFPEMKVATSNHGQRWLKKAAAAEIPEQILRAYREIYAAPEGWQWKEEWLFKDCKSPWRLIHGLGYTGQNGARFAAIDAGISTAIGHLHSHAGVSYIKTLGRKDLIWGMNVGCLIDVQAYAFKYGKYNRFQPCLGVGVILDGGKMPIWLPYE